MSNSKKLDMLFLDFFEDEFNENREDMTYEKLSSWDSLRHLALIESLRTTFETQFDFAEVMKMKSYNSILEVLNGKQSTEANT